MWKMVSAILIKKSMLMAGFLTHNDSDILRAKTGPYRCVGYQTNILPTTEVHRRVRRWAWSLGGGQVGRGGCTCMHKSWNDGNRVWWVPRGYPTHRKIGAARADKW